MTALDQLIAEVQAEAEVKALKMYEDRITVLEAQLKHAQSDLVAWEKDAVRAKAEAKQYEGYYRKLLNELSDLVERS